MAKRNESAAQQALRRAQKAAKTAKTWEQLSNAVFGIGGVCAELFPTQAARQAFVASDEYKLIQQLIAALPGSKAHTKPPEECGGTLVLRIPKTMHAALLAEAEREGVSVNQLCVAKLSVQLAVAMT